MKYSSAFFKILMLEFITMSKKDRWTDPEIAVIVYFRSKGQSVEDCVHILSVKGRARTTDTVTQKLSNLSKDFLLVDENGKWLTERCDHFLQGLDLLDYPGLLAIDEDEERVIIEVGIASDQSINTLTVIKARSDTEDWCLKYQIHHSTAFADDLRLRAFIS